MESIKQVWPHDLLTFNKISDLVLGENPLPEWAKDSLAKAKIVVVRRGEIDNNLIPVGIRGFQRNERLACFLKKEQVVNCYSPDYFIKKQLWKELPPARQNLPQFQALIKMVPLLKEFKWGIGGSVAYEMASGMKIVKNNSEHISDLDVILSATKEISVSQARELLRKINLYGVHADVQVVHGQKGFSLEEYAAGRNKKVLIKTATGPILVENPWNFVRKE